MKKMVYKGHTKYLPTDHSMHGIGVRSIPPRMRACDWLKLWTNAGQIEVAGMKGLNAFYALPYLEHLLINHLLDLMHYFKNVAVSVWQHITGQKDNINSKENLKEANIMRKMWPCENGSLQEAPWILSKEERIVVKRTIKTICIPTKTMHSLKDAFISMNKKELSGLNLMIGTRCCN